MSAILSQDDIEDLLIECGTTPTIWNSHGNMQVCCPVHGEIHPSMGVSSDKQVAHCFSCGFGGNFISLLQNSQPDQFSTYFKAKEFIESRYNVSFEISDKSHNVTRYEDLEEVKEEDYILDIPLYKIAPFMSGKETFKYFFKRGFTKKEMREFMVGRDMVNKTVTLPVFNEDSTLAGVIGRYIDKNRNKNERYKIYNHFRRGRLLYPVNRVNTDSGTLILVEGQFDAMRLHQYGYTNAVSKMGLNLTRYQAKWIKSHCDRVIYIHDNDKRGRESKKEDLKLLEGLDVSFVKYPDHGKDICNWTREEIDEMLSNRESRASTVRRYE